MFTKFAQFLLVATALAPIGFVYAATSFGTVEGRYVGWASLVLVLIAWLILDIGRRQAPQLARVIEEADAIDKEPLAFLVAYALPILTGKTAPNQLGLVVLILFMALVIWQQRLYFVNPLMALMGWRFYKCRDDSGAQVLLISKAEVVSPGRLRVRELTRYLWLLIDQEGKHVQPDRSDWKPK